MRLLISHSPESLTDADHWVSSCFSVLHVSYSMCLTFGLVVLQAVDPAVVSSVSSAEVSLCSLSELIMLGIAAIASDPSSFGLLVGLSSGTVIAAAVVYTIWVYAQSGPTVDSTLRPRAPACELA